MSGSTRAPASTATARERWFLRVVCALTLATPGMLELLSPPPDGALTPRHLLTGAAWLAGALVVVLIADRLLSPLAPMAARAMEAAAAAGRARPHTAIALAAIAATAAAMYPVVFLGRSLVTPNNGGTQMLYREPAPYVPGSDDTSIEPIRNADVGAMMWQLLPYSAIQREALAHGELPLWNRYNAAGRPLWGQGQTFLLDPLHWPVLLAPELAIGWDTKFVLHRIAFAFGVGACVFALTSSWPAAVAMALSAPFARQYLFRLNHPAQFVLTYAPLVLLGWFRLTGAAHHRALASAALWLVAGTALVLVASPPKEAAVMLLCCHAAGALACLLAPPSWTALARQLGVAALAATAALLLTAPHWLVFFDTLGQAATLYDQPDATFTGWSGPISFVFGPLGPGVLVPGVHVAALAAWCAAVAGGRRAWGAPAAVAAMIGVLLAGGVAYGFVPERVIVSLPLLAHVGQIDNTFTAAAIVLVLVAGGVGARAVAEGSIRGPAIAMILACGGLLALIAMSIGDTNLTLRSLELWKVVALCGLGSFIIPVAGVCARRWPDPLALTTTAILALALLAPNSLHTGTGVPALDERLTQPRLRPTFGQDSPALIGLRADTPEPARTGGLNGVMMAGTQALYGLEGFNGADALVLPRYEQFLNATGVPRTGSWEAYISPSNLNGLAPVLDLLGVRHVLGQLNEIPPGFQIVRQHGPDRLGSLRRPTAWPRAFFVGTVQTYDSMAVLAAQVLTATAPFATVDASDARAAAATADLRDPRQSASAGPPPPRVVPATDYSLTPNRTSFRIRAPERGVVVLTEAWMEDDFVATLNGEAASYFRVNHAFKGLVIPSAGDWIVGFRYRPALWPASLGLAGVGALLVVALMVAAVRTEKV